jgi:hypothetical protein
VHGTDDKTIPMAHAVDLHQAIPSVCRAKPYWVIGKGHNNLDYNFDPLVLKLTQFLEEYLGAYKKAKTSKVAATTVVKAKGLTLLPPRLAV